MIVSENTSEVDLLKRVYLCIIDVFIVFCDTEGVVAQWRRSVASGEALVMLHWAMRSVSHWRTAMAIEMALNVGTFVRHRRLF